jgi:hypothetical protein
MEVSMKRTIASLSASFFALFIALAGGAFAQSSPSDDIRESNDPDRAAEVERKAEAISGRSLGGSGESGDETSGEQPRSMPSDDFYAPGEERSAGESGDSEGDSGEPDEILPSPSAPESSGDSGEADESGYGGTGEGETRDSGPPDIGDPYY